MALAWLVLLLFPVVVLGRRGPMILAAAYVNGDLFPWEVLFIAHTCVAATIAVLVAYPLVPRVPRWHTPWRLPVLVGLVAILSASSVAWGWHVTAMLLTTVIITCGCEYIAAVLGARFAARCHDE